MTSLTRTPSERRRARAYVHAAIRPRRTRSRARGRRRPSAAGLCTWCSSSGGRARGSTEALHPWCFKTARLAIGPQALASAESARNAFRELLTLRRRQRLAKVWIKFYNIIIIIPWCIILLYTGTGVINTVVVLWWWPPRYCIF